MFECIGWIGISLIVGGLIFLIISLYSLLTKNDHLYDDVRESDYNDELWEEGNRDEQV